MKECLEVVKSMTISQRITDQFSLASHIHLDIEKIVDICTYSFAHISKQICNLTLFAKEIKIWSEEEINFSKLNIFFLNVIQESSQSAKIK